MPGFAVIDLECNVPMKDPGPHRLAEFAMIRLNDKLEPERTYHEYVEPDGWGVSGRATDENGFDERILEDFGIPLRRVLEEYLDAVREERIVVGFNVATDLRVLRKEMQVLDLPLLDPISSICVMRAAVPVLQLPHADGRAGWKWPKLTEAVQHFGIPYEGPLGCPRDVAATVKVFRELVKRGYCQQAKEGR